MNNTSLIIIAEAGAMAYFLFKDGKQKQTQATKTPAKTNKAFKLKFNSGVPVNMPKDPTALTTQVDYYSKNPNATVSGVLFPYLNNI